MCNAQTIPCRAWGWSISDSNIFSHLSWLWFVDSPWKNYDLSIFTCIKSCFNCWVKRYPRDAKVVRATAQGFNCWNLERWPKKGGCGRSIWWVPSCRTDYCTKRSEMGPAGENWVSSYGELWHYFHNNPTQSMGTIERNGTGPITPYYTIQWV